MKQLVLSAWAWVVAHPAEVTAALYALANAINAAVPVERRRASRALQLLDRLCVLTQRGALNTASWPLVGRSLAKSLAGPWDSHPADCDCPNCESAGHDIPRETQAPPPPSNEGEVSR